MPDPRWARPTRRAAARCLPTAHFAKFAGPGSEYGPAATRDRPRPCRSRRSAELAQPGRSHPASNRTRHLRARSARACSRHCDGDRRFPGHAPRVQTYTDSCQHGRNGRLAGSAMGAANPTGRCPVPADGALRQARRTRIGGQAAATRERPLPAALLLPSRRPPPETKTATRRWPFVRPRRSNYSAAAAAFSALALATAARSSLMRAALPSRPRR